MKIKVFFLFSSLLLLLTSCPTDWYYHDYSNYQPLLMSRDVLETSVFYTNAQALHTPGKIYYKDNMIYIGEKYEGIHVIDNTNPSAPVNKKFISIPGCIDMAIKANTLYADNSVDLVAIDLVNEKLSTRIKKVFPELKAPDGKTVNPKYSKSSRPENTVIIGWKKISTK